MIAEGYVKAGREGLYFLAQGLGLRGDGRASLGVRRMRRNSRRRIGRLGRAKPRRSLSRRGIEARHSRQQCGRRLGAEIEGFPESGWEKVMDLNVKASFFLVQALLGALRAGASARPRSSTSPRSTASR
jgi:hypothetical protein